MGFSRQEYWIGLPYSPPGDLPNPGVELMSLTMSPALAGGFSTTSVTWEAPSTFIELETARPAPKEHHSNGELDVF